MSTSKERILDAAERVVLRDGAAHLTLDAVAQAVPLSKGGVLYNFPTKDALIQGMIARLSQRFAAEMARLAEADPCPTGHLCRAYVNACFPQPTALSAPHDPVAAGLLAAVATNPSLLEPLQESAREIQARLAQDGIDPVRATVIKLAVDGLWMADLFGVNSLDQDLRTQVIERLQALTKGLL
jgi:AcrR family transcriptional regulator